MGAPHWMHLWLLPLCSALTGIHSPSLNCHCIMPLTARNLTLRHVKFSPRAAHASARVLYSWAAVPELPNAPVYHRLVYFVREWCTQS